MSAPLSYYSTDVLCNIHTHRTNLTIMWGSFGGSYCRSYSEAILKNHFEATCHSDEGTRRHSDEGWCPRTGHLTQTLEAYRPSPAPPALPSQGSDPGKKAGGSSSMLTLSLGLHTYIPSLTYHAKLATHARDVPRGAEAYRPSPAPAALPSQGSDPGKEAGGSSSMLTLSLGLHTYLHSTQLIATHGRCAPKKVTKELRNAITWTLYPYSLAPPCESSW